MCTGASTLGRSSRAALDARRGAGDRARGPGVSAAMPRPESVSIRHTIPAAHLPTPANLPNLNAKSAGASVRSVGPSREREGGGEPPVLLPKTPLVQSIQ